MVKKLSVTEELSKKNGMVIHDVRENAFKEFGRVVQGYNFEELIRYMEDVSEIPEHGNVYLASIKEMENTEVCAQVQKNLYGGMPIQIGYCNGRNTTYNGFEYHKGSEINIAVTDFMLVLGHVWDIKDNTYQSSNAQVFFVEKGTVIEMYQTTLHLSPCRVCDEGFKDIVILPRGTNTPLKETKDKLEAENVLLLQTNKWVLSHPDREPLIKQGAYPGFLGENRELFY